MSSRGFLICKFLAEWARLDSSGTRSAGGYDDDFLEINKTDTDGDGIGESNRVDHSLVRIPCQIESGPFMSEDDPHVLGPNPVIQRQLVHHFKDLERMSLVDSDGIALIKPGDQLVAIYDLYGTLVERIPDPPGLYVIEAEPRGWGISLRRPKRNLLLVKCGDRRIA